MDNYWENRQMRSSKAKYHTIEMNEKFMDDIEKSILGSKIYTGPNYINLERNCKTDIIIESMDSVTAIKKYVNKYIENNTVVLNFASYKYPGGKFLEGSCAQEECLCHESNLYNVLKGFPDYYDWNKKNLYKSLYLDRAIFSPNIIFVDKNFGYEKCNVITCAAPNYSAARKYRNASKEENLDVLKCRIDFVLSIAADQKQKILILGAFGCGVFGQDPYIVSSIFKTLLSTKYKDVFDTVVFAIPKSNKNNNLEAFLNVFND